MTSTIVEVLLDLCCVTVRPGDMPVGDSTKLVCVPIEHTKAVLVTARYAVLVEACAAELLEAGGDYFLSCKQADAEFKTLFAQLQETGCAPLGSSLFLCLLTLQPAGLRRSSM